MLPYDSMDAYIANFPQEVHDQLQAIRMVVKEIVPDAMETINYGIPTFKLKGNLVHFAAYKNHIGFYPGASGIKAFVPRFIDYHYSKGAVQFPLNQPLPLDLIKEIVLFRVNENMSKP
ncbi:MAG: DUF1801 domain-containing protein [Chitinophagales bacterium]|nr:DUF1801 domain-containing protein [Chitinophagales bacterium]